MIAQARKEKGWTQQRVADKLGISSATVWMVESRSAGDGNYYRIGKLLGVDVLGALKKRRALFASNRGKGATVRCVYFVGNRGYQIEGYIAEPKDKYKNSFVVKVTKGEELLKRFPAFDKVLVSKDKVEFI
ncbi:helix-turn-helix domain-containing protein [Bacillus subtilis]